MIGIAVRMYKTGTTSISADLFQTIIQELLDLFPDDLSARNSVFMNLRNGKSLREFADADINSMSAIINDVRTCGVLVNDTANEELCFAHKSFFDVLTAKFFLGKNIANRSTAAIISAALAKSPTYNSRLKNDIVVRKLLAEFISAEIDMPAGQYDDKIRCRRIFEHCKNIISFQNSWQTPQSMFQRCMQEKDVPSTGTSDVQWQQDQSILRLLSTLLLPIAACVLFFIKGIDFVQYKADAANYYAQFSALEPVAQSPVAIPVLPVILTTLLSIVLFVLLGYASKGMSLFFREKYELILLTWYYACKENQIPDKVIFQQFSRKYAKAFAEYVQGRNLEELQGQLRRSKRTPTKSRGQRL